MIALLLLAQFTIPMRTGATAVAPVSNCGAYAYCEAIIVSASKMGSTDQTGFPVLVTGSTNTKTTGNGGKATSASGFDVVYFAGTACTGTKLAWETEVYSASSTASDYWILPAVTVSHTTDTTVGYRCIGNASVTTDQSNKTAVWDSNYAVVQHLPNGTTLTATDSTTNANNGTLVNAPTATAGQIDGAANLASASSQSIDLGSSSTLKIGGSLTLEAWVLYTGTVASGGPRIVSNLTSSAFTGAEIWMQPNACCANLQADFQVGNAGTLKNLFGAALSAGTPYKIVATYNGTTGSLYINGTLSNSSTWGAGAIGTTTANTLIGAFGGSTTANWNGWIDEVRVSKIARSADWILAEYNNESSPSTFYTLVPQ
jgi:hypothetical protein